MVNLVSINNVISFSIAVAIDKNYKLAWFEKGWCEDELKQFGQALQR